MLQLYKTKDSIGTHPVYFTGYRPNRRDLVRRDTTASVATESNPFLDIDLVVSAIVEKYEREGFRSTDARQSEFSATDSSSTSRAPCAPEGLRQERERKLRRYLNKLGQHGLISEAMAERAHKVWYWLDRATENRVPAPDVGPGPNGEVLFVWDTEEEHFEIELSPCETAYLFYRNRKTGSVWGVDWAEDASIPEEALRRLSAFWR